MVDSTVLQQGVDLGKILEGNDKKKICSARAS